MSTSRLSQLLLLGVTPNDEDLRIAGKRIVNIECLLGFSFPSLSSIIMMVAGVNIPAFHLINLACVCGFGGALLLFAYKKPLMGALLYDIILMATLFLCTRYADAELVVPTMLVSLIMVVLAHIPNRPKWIYGITGSFVILTVVFHVAPVPASNNTLE